MFVEGRWVGHLASASLSCIHSPHYCNITAHNIFAFTITSDNNFLHSPASDRGEIPPHPHCPERTLRARKCCAWAPAQTCHRVTISCTCERRGQGYEPQAHQTLSVARVPWSFVSVAPRTPRCPSLRVRPLQPWPCPMCLLCLPGATRPPWLRNHYMRVGTCVGVLLGWMIKAQNYRMIDETQTPTSTSPGMSSRRALASPGKGRLAFPCLGRALHRY